MTLTTWDHAMRMLGVRLRAAGLPTPELDARLLVQGVTGASDIAMLREPGTRMSDDEEARLDAFEKRRLAGEPVSRILGLREFWGLPFAVTPATLDPRPDSETLVETALALLCDVARPRILDLGTGTGCLLLSLLHEREDAHGTGADISHEALAVAASNAARLGLSARAVFHQGIWTDGIEGPFDLVISNPPYIRHADRYVSLPADEDVLAVGANRAMAILAEALFLINLMLLPVIGFVMLMLLWLVHRRHSSPLVRNHLQQTVAVSIKGGFILVGQCQPSCSGAVANSSSMETKGTM